MTRLVTRFRVVGLVVALTGLLIEVASAASAPNAASRPNIIVILFDDLGFGDLGCYGGEIHTPNIDRLAASGVRFTRFYNAARCCPTRAALLTGLYSHQVGLAHNGRNLARDAATIAELLRAAGYQTAMAGKWHLSETVPLNGKSMSREHFAWLEHQANDDRPFADPGTYPVNRGFERHYGTIWGVVDYFDPFSLVEGTKPVKTVPDDYHLTDAITAKSVEFIETMSRKEMPFFLYVAHCAPHWPLHARAEDINRYHDTYRSGWHALRDQRYRKQVGMKLIDPVTHPLPKLMGTGRDWDALSAEERDHESNLMAVHAAMVDRVDQGVGAILRTLQAARCSENTIIFLLSDNGASPERYLDPGFDRPSATRDGQLIRYAGRFTPGVETTWGYIGAYWASAVNTPFRYWKAQSFEGGCHTPMIVQWPAGLTLPVGSTVNQLGHVIDLMPTCLELAGTSYPTHRAGHRLAPLEGKSLVAILQGRQHEDLPDTLFFEHEGGRAVIANGWKLVAQPKADWELYHLASDATETHDLSKSQPRRVGELAEKWRVWAARVGAPIPSGSR